MHCSTETRVVWLAVWLFAAGCTPIDPFEAPDAEAPDAATDDAGPDARVVRPQEGGSYCDQTGDCLACVVCAIGDFELCSVPAQTCVTDRCRAAVACLSACATAECTRGCLDGEPLESLFEDAPVERCAACLACPRDCGTARPACAPS